MTVQVFKNEEINTEIRGLIINSEPWFVAKDVCKGLDLSDTSRAVARLDDDEKGTASIRTLGSEQDLLIVNEPGLYRLILSSRKQEAKAFQRWVTHEVLPSIRKAGSYRISNQPLQGNEVALVGKMSEDIEKLFAVKHGIAISQAIDIVNKNCKVDLNNLKQLLPHETGYLNATTIGRRLDGLPSRLVNKELQSACLQYKDGKSWRLTALGFEFGEEVPYIAPDGHSRYQIRWNEKVVDYLKERRSRR